MRHVVLFVAFALLASQGHAQAGRWVLDGWPHERHGFFAGRTEVVADGARLKITEWPENTEDAASSLVTYFMGQTVVKVFPWQGERVGLVFESDTPLPRAERNSEGQLVLPPPFPRERARKERCLVETGASTTCGQRRLNRWMKGRLPQARRWPMPSWCPIPSRSSARTNSSRATAWHLPS